MAVYRRQLDRAIGMAADPGAWTERLRDEMNRAAAERQYEAAGACKTLLERGAFFASQEASRFARLGRFDWATVQPGSGRGKAKVFIAAGGRIACVGEIGRKNREGAAEAAAAQISRSRDQAGEWRADDAAIDRLGLAAWHVLNTAHDPRRFGLWLPIEKACEAKALVGAIETVTGGGG